MKLTGDNVLRLEVLVSTMGRDGIQRVAMMTLPRVEGVAYTVSWQCPEGDVPAVLVRDDVRIEKSFSTGLSNNRNDAFNVSRGPLLLIADDDLHYTDEGLETVITTMNSHPELDFATFAHEGGDCKWFPSEEFDLEHPVKGYYVTSFEIVVRRSVVAGVDAPKFDSRFGLGNERFGAGEEQLFINDMLNNGYKGRFFPVSIVTHPGLTTSQKGVTEGLLRSQGAVARDTLPKYRALARAVHDAWRYSRQGKYPLSESLKLLIEGWRFKR